MHCAFEHCLFTCKFFCLIFLWECHFYFCLFVDLSSDQLLFKSRDKCTGTDRQRVILTLSAFKRNSVYKSFKVKCNNILVLNSSVCNFYCSGITLTLFLDLFIYFFLHNSCRYLVYLKSLILAKLYFWLYSYFCCKDKVFSFFKLDNINCRLGSDLKFTLIICLSISFRNHVICCFIIEYFRSVHFFDHLTRNFSLTESRKADLATLL